VRRAQQARLAQAARGLEHDQPTAAIPDALQRVLEGALLRAALQ
jgi:hypothetical protein